VRQAGVLALLVAALTASNAAAASGVQVRVSYEMTGIFTEGYVWFASLDHAKPTRVTTRSVVLPAGPGKHVLRVFIRPCDGNCSFLDPPQQRCSATVRRGQKVTYRLRDQGCKLIVHG
jgi:hypothetical protein